MVRHEQSHDDGKVRALVVSLVEIFEKLRTHGICSPSDVAEFLFEYALNGKRVAKGLSDYDLIAPHFGRVQVKFRQLPPDRRVEQRLHCKNIRQGAFDHLAAVILNNDFTVKCATVVSLTEAWPLIERSTDPEKKIRFEAFAAVSGALDHTTKLQQVLRLGPPGLLELQEAMHATSIPIEPPA